MEVNGGSTWGKKAITARDSPTRGNRWAAAEDKSWEEILGTSPPSPERQSQRCPSPPWKQLQLLEFPNTAPVTVNLHQVTEKDQASVQALYKPLPKPLSKKTTPLVTPLSKPLPKPQSNSRLHAVILFHLLRASRNAAPLLPGNSSSSWSFLTQIQV